MPKKFSALTSCGGFSLIEALIAIIIVSLVVVPVSHRIYKVRKESQEIRKLEGLQALQIIMNRLVLTRRADAARGPIHELPGTELEIKIEKSFSEARIIGTVREKSGKTISTLVYPWFSEASD